MASPRSIACLGALAASLFTAPAARAGAEPAAKWCSGVKVAAFAGGPQGDSFAAAVVSGFKQAELDLGPTVTYYFSDWNPNTLLTQINQALAAKVDGIATFGIGGEAATGRMVDQLYAAGGVFTSLNTPLRKAEARYAAKGFGFVGAPNYKAGVALASESAVRARLVKADTVLVWGVKGKGGERAQRTIGVIDTFTKAGAKVIYQEIDAATLANPNAGTAVFAGLMQKNPTIKIVVTDNGGLTANAAVLAKAASLAPGKVFFAGFELTEASAKAVADGFQMLVLDQQPFLQGYLSLLNVCLSKKFGFQGLDIDTAGAFVDKSNVDTVSALIAKGIR